MHTNQFDQMKEIAENVISYHKEYIELKSDYEKIHDTLREYRSAAFSDANEYRQIIDTIKNLENQIQKIKNEMDQFFGLFEITLNQAHEAGWEDGMAAKIDGMYVIPYENYWEVIKNEHQYTGSGYMDWWAFHHKVSNETKNVYGGWHATLPIKKLDEIKGN